MVIYGVPRVTGDIDITIDPGEKGLRGLLAPLRRAGFVSRISDPSFAIETRIYPVTHRATGWDTARVASDICLPATRPLSFRRSTAPSASGPNHWFSWTS